MGQQGATRVELLRLQKAAGFGHLEETKLRWEGQAGQRGTAGCREARSTCVQCTAARGSKGTGRGWHAGKTYLHACVCIYTATSL